MYFSTQSTPTGRAIVSGISGNVLATYNGADERLAAEGVAFTAYAAELNALKNGNFIGGGDLRNALQSDLRLAWGRKVEAEAATVADNAADAAEDALYARFVARLIDDEYITE